MSKLWGGRFTSRTNPNLECLNSSIHLDRRMFAEDVEGSKAYAKALRAINVLTNEEMLKICDGLDKIKLEWENETFLIKDGDEDVHTANERRLKELIGEPATKLHVGRSRNDQVVTDMKLWLRSKLKVLNELIRTFIDTMITKCVDEIDVIMPGYTHLQRAQPIRFSHWLLSHAWNFKIDCDKTESLLKQLNVMPLGSGASAGNPFNIDRYSLAYKLGFNDVTQNSMQAVSDRDFVADFLYWSSLVGVHLSRLAEDLIIYSSKEFDFVLIDDAYSTGSSLMPQKRNPDSLELIRSVGGSLFGQCCSFMMVLKGLPSTYNKDLQSDKEYLFGTFDKLKLIVEVANGTIKTLKVNVNKCTRALSADMLATDLAYYLVKKNVPFREAHEISGKVVLAAEKKGVVLSDLTLEELKSINDKFEADVAKVWNYENSIEQYQVVGGTSKLSVLNQIEKLEAWLGRSNKTE